MRIIAASIVMLLVGCLVVGIYFAATGTTARTAPGELETWVARGIRGLATPRGIRDRKNPVPDDRAAREAGLAHFADHCAGCHGNDGSGDTAMGRGLSPRAPDMRLPATQRMTDGELFAIIENGVRFTGMPAFGDGTPEGERGSWQLVRFIRHLPTLSPDELEQMKRLNPQPPAEFRRQMEEEAFLRGEDKK